MSRSSNVLEIVYFFMINTVFSYLKAVYTCQKFKVIATVGKIKLIEA
jgi:hypothetical protein